MDKELKITGNDIGGSGTITVSMGGKNNRSPLSLEFVSDDKKRKLIFNVHGEWCRALASFLVEVT